MKKPVTTPEEQVGAAGMGGGVEGKEGAGLFRDGLSTSRVPREAKINHWKCFRDHSKSNANKEMGRLLRPRWRRGRCSELRTRRTRMRSVGRGRAGE